LKADTIRFVESPTSAMPMVMRALASVACHGAVIFVVIILRLFVGVRMALCGVSVVGVVVGVMMPWVAEHLSQQVDGSSDAEDCHGTIETVWKTSPRR
jgi:hypothetical protein